jgi:hypothetical protein
MRMCDGVWASAASASEGASWTPILQRVSQRERRANRFGIGLTYRDVEPLANAVKSASTDTRSLCGLHDVSVAVFQTPAQMCRGSLPQRHGAGAVHVIVPAASVHVHCTAAEVVWHVVGAGGVTGGVTTGGVVTGGVGAEGVVVDTVIALSAVNDDGVVCVTTKSAGLRVLYARQP